VVNGKSRKGDLLLIAAIIISYLFQIFNLTLLQKVQIPSYPCLRRGRLHEGRHPEPAEIIG
jgi:hypothetical protein